MTKRSPLNRGLAPAVRQSLHLSLQRRLGHWTPDGTPGPRKLGTYRAARRNKKLGRIK
jgi:hypothetical protein